MGPKLDCFTSTSWPAWDVIIHVVDKPKSLRERIERLERELQQLRREMREIALPRIHDLESRHPAWPPLWATPKAPYEGKR